MQPQIHRSSTKVHMKDGPPVWLSYEQVKFCHKHGYWPTKVFLEINNPTEQDKAMAEELKQQIRHMEIKYTTKT
jgi:hypothetical protein